MPLNLLMAKKSQIQMAETIAVLFVFFILLAIGFIFYGRITAGNLQSQKDEFAQLNSVSIAQRAMFLPELQCSEDIVEEITGCFDLLKINSSQDIMRQNSRHYYDLFEFSNITIHQIYPNNREWVVYERRIEGFESKFVTNIPVSLYDPITRRYGFGVIAVETLSR